MTTPSEEEARVEAERRWPIRPGGVTDTRDVPDLLRYRAVFEQGAMWAASRVSTPPSEDWEYFVRTLAHGDVAAFSYDDAVAKLADVRYRTGKVMRRRKAGPLEPVPAVPVLPTDPAACTLPGHQGCEWFGAIQTHHPAPTEPEEV